MRQGSSEIPAYAAAARNDDYEAFPPTITFVGTLEPFYWETRVYVQALQNAGVEVRFEEFENCFHAFDTVAADADIAKAALAFTFDSYAEFYDRFAVAKPLG